LLWRIFENAPASAFPAVRLRRTGLASELELNGITSLHFESAIGGLQGASIQSSRVPRKGGDTKFHL